ncbi:MAG: ribonuclease III [Ilumatobacteraceae bacterium]
MNEAQLRECAEVVGHDFVDWSLLVRALTHSSYSAESPDEPSNERLEYLGDAVLGLVLADEMYRRHPDFHEGLLTDLRKSVVNETTLGGAARRMGLGRFIRLGRGEEAAGGHDKTSILANAFEAVIGAVHLDAGTEIARRLSLRLLRDDIDAAVPGLRTLDPKTQLQELTQDNELGAPYYEITDEGPDHEKTFFAEVLIAGRVHGRGSGRTKKAAEQEAAAQAIESLRSGDA